MGLVVPFRNHLAANPQRKCWQEEKKKKCAMMQVEEKAKLERCFQLSHCFISFLVLARVV